MVKKKKPKKPKNTEYLLASVSKLSEPFKSRCAEILKMLDNDVDSTKQAILELENRMKQFLKI
jgi:hypothetical protein